MGHEKDDLAQLLRLPESRFRRSYKSVISVLTYAEVDERKGRPWATSEFKERVVAALETDQIGYSSAVKGAVNIILKNPVKQTVLRALIHEMLQDEVEAFKAARSPLPQIGMPRI